MLGTQWTVWNFFTLAILREKRNVSELPYIHIEYLRTPIRKGKDTALGRVEWLDLEKPCFLEVGNSGIHEGTHLVQILFLRPRAGQGKAFISL